jgi:hypothetical protein
MKSHAASMLFAPLKIGRRAKGLALLSLVAASSAHAGFVTWGAPQTIMGESDVSTAGTLVVAHNLGGTGNTSATVGGVTFTPFATSTPVNTQGNVMISASSNINGEDLNFGDFDPPFTGLSTDYQTLLQSGSYTVGVVPPTISVSLSGLIPGADYQFQWWVHQPSNFSSPGFPPPGVATTTATSGGSVTLDRNGLIPGTLGQFAIGTFTADATPQVITFSGSDIRTVINAFQLRQVSSPPIPEPGSILFGLAVSGFLLASASRRRRAGVALDSTL